MSAKRRIAATWRGRRRAADASSALPSIPALNAIAGRSALTAALEITSKRKGRQASGLIHGEP